MLQGLSHQFFPSIRVLNPSCVLGTFLPATGCPQLCPPAWFPGPRFLTRNPTDLLDPLPPINSGSSLHLPGPQARWMGFLQVMLCESPRHLRGSPAAQPRTLPVCSFLGRQPGKKERFNSSLGIRPGLLKLIHSLVHSFSYLLFLSAFVDSSKITL